MHSEQLCRHIVESSYQIRRTLLGQTSGVEVGLCILGYRACVNDSITLNRIRAFRTLGTGVVPSMPHSRGPCQR